MPRHKIQVTAPPPDFEIGLALAGAISAGAYTAGVIDFMIQALQAWEKERGGDVPGHTTKLRTVAGASAGAITGAIGVIALARGLRPEKLSETEIATSHRTEGTTYQTSRCMLPALYDAWVVRPRMVANDETAMDLLGTDDLASRPGEKPVDVESFLNARVLDDIRDRTLGAPELPAEPCDAPPFPFLAKTMHVYMTVSNLRGIPYEVAFGNSTYGMQTHGDRMLYEIVGLGSDDWRRESWLDEDKATATLHIRTLPQCPGDPVSPEWTDFGTASLASGAFPGGLAPRTIVAPFDTYTGRQYPLPLPADAIITPKFPASMRGAAAYRFLNVDGGVINNNPFDYVQFAIMGHPRAGSDVPSEADRAVIMIAPFPEPPTFLPEGRPASDLATVLRALFPTLINQARFRASELGPAMDPDDRSRFLISPHRSLIGGPDETYAIACGLLGGFGGFLDETFRAHDFQLGRRNCQRFLMTTFGLPAANPVIAKTPQSLNFPLPRPSARPGRAMPPQEYMIIPLVGDAVHEVALPHWPKMSGRDLRTLMKRIEGRLNAVMPRLIDSQTDKPIVRRIARIGLWFQKDRILKVVQMTILADLVRRNQITGWDLPPSVVAVIKMHNYRLRNGKSTKRTLKKLIVKKDRVKEDHVRALLAELVRPSRPSCTVADLVAVTHLPVGFVERILAELQDVPEGKPLRVVRTGPAGHSVYTLEMHLLTGIRSWPVVGPVVAWFAPRIYDYA